MNVKILQRPFHEAQKYNYIIIAPAVYRGLALLIAWVQMHFAYQVDNDRMLIYLVVFASLYTLFKIIHPFKWYREKYLRLVLFAADIIVCAGLLVFSGGLYSPFLLYTLAPVLTTALLNNKNFTAVITLITILYVMNAHAFNPFRETELGLAELSYFWIYIVAVGLTAVLPYLINANMWQFLKSQAVVDERQRLSREIHDGAMQALSVMRWQIQMLQRRLIDSNITIAEANELQSLVDNAYNNARESLDFLRSYNDENYSFLNLIKKNIDTLQTVSKIDFHLEIPRHRIKFPAVVELEIIRVCQEAITNIRKHSNAKNAWFVLSEQPDKLVDIIIKDDGQGFGNFRWREQDTKHRHGYGLSVMRERMESIGGTLNISSKNGKGTEIHIIVPKDNWQFKPAVYDYLGSKI